MMSRWCALFLMLGMIFAPTSSSAFQGLNDTVHQQNVEYGYSGGNGVSGMNDSQSAGSVADNIPDNATMVSKNFAVTTNGEVKNIVTGETVGDPKIIGTNAHPADPLYRTGGTGFIPHKVSEVRDGLEHDNHASASFERSSIAPSAGMSESAQIGVLSLQNNGYGAHWGTYGGSQAFFEADGTLFAQQAKGVIDVSQWQGDIDWNAARGAGVEAAIIRLGYGWGNGLDNKARRNINECKRLGIPFGLYLYSYAYDAATARQEGEGTADLLRQAGVKPSDLSMPIYYDLEHWAWKGHVPPNSPVVYDSIVDAWYGRLQAAGFARLSVYSYTSYLNTALNSTRIHQRTNWVASYGSRTGFAFPANRRCWQYADNGRISGIGGAVDLNACGVLTPEASIDMNRLESVNLPDGKYYINLHKRDASSIDIAGGSLSREIPLQIYSYNNTKAQQFEFRRQGDGSYVIANVNSGKVLDVSSGQAHNGATVWQYDFNGTAAQRWYLRDAGNAYYLQSALGNWVLNVTVGSFADGSTIVLSSPDGSDCQRFQLASTTSVDVSSHYRLESAAGADLVLDVPGASHNNDVGLQLYDWNGTDAQLYAFTQVGNGVYTIKNAASGKQVEVQGGRNSNGAKVQQYAGNGTQAQRWMIRDFGGQSFGFIGSASNKALDVPSGLAMAGKGLQIYTQNGSKAQQWKLTKEMTGPDRLASLHRNDLPDGHYRIPSKINGSYVIDVSGGSYEDGATVQLYSANGTGAQQWSVTQDASGYRTIVNERSGKVLDVAGAASSNGARVQQYRANGTDAQKWIIRRESDGVYSIISALSTDKLIDIPSGRITNGNPLQLYASNSTGAQRWKFTR